jgi:hypothetical protein
MCEALGSAPSMTEKRVNFQIFGAFFVVDIVSLLISDLIML